MNETTFFTPLKMYFSFPAEKKLNMKSNLAGSTPLLLFFSPIREPYFFSPIQHIEGNLVSGWSSNSKIKWTITKILAIVARHCFSLISGVVGVKMGQGEARSISRQDPWRFEPVWLKVGAEIEAWRRLSCKIGRIWQKWVCIHRVRFFFFLKMRRHCSEMEHLKGVSNTHHQKRRL